jgi:hypothetical protein
MAKREVIEAHECDNSRYSSNYLIPPAQFKSQLTKPNDKFQIVKVFWVSHNRCKYFMVFLVSHVIAESRNNSRLYLNTWFHSLNSSFWAVRVHHTGKIECLSPPMSWVQIPVRLVPHVIERATLFDGLGFHRGSGFLLHLHYKSPNIVQPEPIVSKLIFGSYFKIFYFTHLFE